LNISISSLYKKNRQLKMTLLSMLFFGWEQKPGGAGGRPLDGKSLNYSIYLKDEVSQGNQGEDIDQPVNFPAFSGDQLDQRISNEAESNTAGDAVGQGHDDHGQESWEGLGEVVEINFHHGADHENPDDYQGRSGGFGRNQTGQGGDEESKQEEHARYN